VSDWQPIDTAPVGEDVLIHSPDAECEVYIAHRFEADDDWYPQHETVNDGAPYEIAFTHWMPLPDAPRSSKLNNQQN
jgi:hypothetical protein